MLDKELKLTKVLFAIGYTLIAILILRCDMLLKHKLMLLALFTPSTLFMLKVVLTEIEQKYYRKSCERCIYFKHLTGSYGLCQHTYFKDLDLEKTYTWCTCAKHDDGYLDSGDIYGY